MALFITKEMHGKPTTPFLHHASFAVAFEQDGRFADAALSWDMAQRAAVKEVDRLWADDRRAFCSSALARGWGQHYAGGGVQ